MKTYTRTCIICHKEFITDNPSKKICPNTHYRKCPFCGKDVVWNKTQPFKGCRDCVYQNAVKKRKKTMTEKYGAPTTLQSKQLTSKYKDTMAERYGESNPMLLKQFQQKAQQTNLERYGAPNVMQNRDIAHKSAQERMKDMPAIVERIKDTWMTKYGVDNVSKLPQTIDKITATFITKYGVKRAAQVPEFRQKMIDTNMQKFGVPFYVQTKECRESNGNTISHINLEFSERLTRLGIPHTMEFKLGRKSYDIKLDNTNILIEINPTYTHNIVGNHWNKHGIPEDYHLEKTLKAESSGYRCIHVFDWDDWNKVMEIIEPTKSIYARNCSIFILNSEVSENLLRLHHLQGTCRGQLLHVGLVYEGQLVQVMTFGKSRYNNNYDMELLRMCTSPGYRVIGGASKLFSWVTGTYELSNIISYCDRSKFTGDVYERMGMKLHHISPPQEVWSKGKERITANLLRKHGYDRIFHTDYGKGTSNELLMLQNGWLPVYDCGQAIYVYDVR